MKKSTTLTNESLTALRANQTRPMKPEDIEKTVAQFIAANPKFSFTTKGYCTHVKLGTKHILDIWMKTTAYRVYIADKNLTALPKDVQKTLSERSITRKDEVVPNEVVIMPDEIDSLLADFLPAEPKAESKQPEVKKTTGKKTGGKKQPAKK